MASCSHVDHATRIQTILSDPDSVSVYDVKYVVIDGVGDCFCINENEKQVIIPVGYHNVGAASEVDVTLKSIRVEKHSRRYFKQKKGITGASRSLGERATKRNRRKK